MLCLLLGLMMDGKQYLKKHCRGFLPITIDLETSGSDVNQHGILEIAAVFPSFSDEGLHITNVFHRHVRLEKGDKIDPNASLVHQIPIDHPFLYAVSLEDMLRDLSKVIKSQCDHLGARRGMIVAHNPSFDMAFLNQASSKYSTELFMHRYTFLDTASMGLMRHRETVLAKLCFREGLGFSQSDAHSALYDAHMTSRLFWSFMGVKTVPSLYDRDIHYL